jgi:hypothetical protein
VCDSQSWTFRNQAKQILVIPLRAPKLPAKTKTSEEVDFGPMTKIVSNPLNPAISAAQEFKPDN